MAPSVGFSRPAIRRSSVVLPEPEGPSSAISSPERISSDTSWSAGKRSNSLRTWTTRTSIRHPRKRRKNGAAVAISVGAAGRYIVAVTQFKQGLQHQRHQRKPGKQRGDGEGARRIILIVQDLDVQRHGVGEAADMA